MATNGIAGRSLGATPAGAASPLRTIVVGVQDPDAARDAVTLALDLAAPGARIVVTALAVDPLSDPRVGPMLAGERIAMAARSAGIVRAELLGRAGDVVVTEDVRPASSVGAGMRAVALDHAADLIVVGASRRSPALRLVGVTGVRAALDRAPCAVAIAPRGYAEAAPRLRRIGAGWDHTPAADAAVELADRLARNCGVDLRVVRVVSPGPRAMAPLGGRRRERKLRASLAADRLGDLGLPGVAVEVIEDDSPVSVLSRTSERLDLLVVGATMRDGALHAGRTTHGLLRHLGCALLVAPQA